MLLDFCQALECQFNVNGQRTLLFKGRSIYCIFSQIILEDDPKQPYEGNKEDWEEGQEPVWKKEGNKHKFDVVWDLEKEVCLTIPCIVRVRASESGV